jgi:hypothetical protein
MTNPFLPISVHYANEPQYKNALEIAMNEKYDCMLFDPKNIETDMVFVLLETENDTRVLHTRYDSCLDRFFPSDSDTLHVFQTRSSAFRYLQKRSRIRERSEMNLE